MDINRINNILTAPTNDDKGAKQTKQDNQGVAEQPASSNSKPAVEFSDDSQKINQITNDLINESVVDHAKVNRIKAQIQEGTYKYLQPDQAQLESLAEKFIDLESDIEDLL